MKKTIISATLTILILIIVSCKSGETGDRRKEWSTQQAASAKSADATVTPDQDVVAPYSWINKIDGGGQADKFEIFRVDASDPDSVKIYAHALDVDMNMIENMFEDKGYRVCGFVDNDRVVEEYTVKSYVKNDADSYDVSFVLDHSGSIGSERALKIQEALLGVVDLKFDDDAFAVVKFDHRVNEELPLTNDKNAIKSSFALTGLNGYGGSTALYDAINTGLKSVEDSRNRKVVIAISDGLDNSSNKTLNNVLQKAVDEKTAVFTVGFGSAIDEPRMEYIAQRTGGKFYHIYRTDEFAKVFQDIYKRINTYYEIVYSPINKGKHELEITLCKKRGNLIASAVYYNDNVEEDCPVNLSLEIRGERHDGTESYFPEFTIWERYKREYSPLLPYIFFEENSSMIPSRYIKRNPGYIDSDEEFAYVKKFDRLKIYYDILNIIGERWRKFSNAHITLTGCIDGKTEGPDNLALSQARADAVKNYLTGVCGVPARFVKVIPRNMPATPSGINNKDAQEENRRVEIDCDDPRILEPFIYDEFTYESSPPTVRTYVNMNPKEDTYMWEAVLYHENKVIWSNEAFSDSPTRFVDYALSEDILFDKGKGQDIIYGDPEFKAVLRVFLDSTKTKTCETSQDIEIVQNTIEEIRRKCLGEWQVEVLNLILFPINNASYQRDEYNRVFMEKKIESLLEEFPIGAYFDIGGHTDIIGTTDGNKILSCRRANDITGGIENVIARSGADAYIRKKSCYGEAVLPQFYDNSLPEARMYCRTVIIYMFLPIPCEKK